MYQQQHLPHYQIHKSSNQAYVAIHGRDYFLGKYGSDVSYANYGRLIVESQRSIRIGSGFSESVGTLVYLGDTAEFGQTRARHGTEKGFDVPTLTPSERRRLLKLKKTVDPRNEYIGESDTVLRVVEQIVRCNQDTSRNVLLIGPPGTGKSCLAKRIHDSSDRAGKPYERQPVTTERSGDPSLMFGKWKGIGPNHGLAEIPKEGQDGILKKCSGGTIFLDDFQAACDEFQLLLLDVAERMWFSPHAGNGEQYHADVRLILGTNEDPDDLVNNGNLRPDLYDRISRPRIDLPPLDHRREDIFLFVNEWCGKYKVTERFRLACLTSAWPGNVRQLKTSIDLAKQAADFKNDKKLDVACLEGGIDCETMTQVNSIDECQAGRKVVEMLNQILVGQGFSHGRGLNTRMAEILGVSKATIGRRRCQILSS